MVDLESLKTEADERVADLLLAVQRDRSGNAVLSLVVEDVFGTDTLAEWRLDVDPNADWNALHREVLRVLESEGLPGCMRWKPIRSGMLGVLYSAPVEID